MASTDIFNSTFPFCAVNSTSEPTGYGKIPTFESGVPTKLVLFGNGLSRDGVLVSLTSKPLSFNDSCEHHDQTAGFKLTPEGDNVAEVVVTVSKAESTDAYFCVSDGTSGYVHQGNGSLIKVHVSVTSGLPLWLQVRLLKCLNPAARLPGDGAFSFSTA